MKIDEKNVTVYQAIVKAGLLDGDTFFIGENRNYGEGLNIDLIPQTSWGINVRSSLSNKDWQLIRELVLARENYTCELCGEKNLPLHCHERFSFNTINHVQRLERLLCICENCHTSIHFGHASLTGKEEEAINHLIKVKYPHLNKKRGKKLVNQEIKEAKVLWEDLSQIEFTLDLSILTDSGFKVFTNNKEQLRERYKKRFLDIEIGENIYHIKYKDWDIGTRHYLYIDEDNTEEKNIGVFNLTKNNVFYPNQQCNVAKDDLKLLIAELRRILNLPLMQ